MCDVSICEFSTIKWIFIFKEKNRVRVCVCVHLTLVWMKDVNCESTLLFETVSFTEPRTHQFG